jgi:hypothetical protein
MHKALFTGLVHNINYACLWNFTKTWDCCVGHMTTLFDKISHNIIKRDPLFWNLDEIRSVQVFPPCVLPGLPAPPSGYGRGE